MSRDTIAQRGLSARWRLPAWLAPAVLIGLAATVVWVAPAERTLGEAIRAVYVHVALTWAGLLGLTVAAVLGVGVAVTGRGRWAAWMQAVTAVGLALFALGTATSVVAAQITWGGGFIDEPRTRTALSILAVAVIVTVGGSWLPWARVRGLLAAGLIVYAAVALRLTPLMLHPRNPIATSSSSGIQATFVSLFVIFALLGAWATWRLRAAAGERTWN